MAKSDEVEKRRLQPNISGLDALASMNTDSVRPTKVIKWKGDLFEPYFEPERDAEMESMLRNFKRGMTMKRNMLNRKLRRAKAKAKCPDPNCDGWWFGILAGPRNHIHVHCTGTCRFKMME